MAYLLLDLGRTESLFPPKAALLFWQVYKPQNYFEFLSSSSAFQLVIVLITCFDAITNYLLIAM